MSDAVRAMFGRIARRYDLANRLLSAGQDLRWRRQALAMLAPGTGNLLDLACGTGDLIVDALRGGHVRSAVGADFCAPMLRAGQAKLRDLPVRCVVADATALPFADACFDAASVAYGWRNFDDPRRSAAELARVVRPGGQLLILEFFRPRHAWPRLFYRVFGRLVLPTAGGLIAGDRSAYRYLHDSVQRFLSIDEACNLLASEGFTAIRTASFFGGVSHAIHARRP